MPTPPSPRPALPLRPAMLAVALLAALGLTALGQAGLWVTDWATGWGAPSWQSAWVMALAWWVLAAWAGPRLIQSLTARYDLATLSPSPAEARRAAAASSGLIEPIERWCLAGLGSGRTAFWRPHALPDVTERLSVATLAGPVPSAAIVALARRLDRDDELAALAAVSRRQAITLKLAVKWQELWWWRARHPRQAWDCGWLREDVSALADFRPRRPTLVIAQGLPASAIGAAVPLLVAAHHDYRHPVRLLVLDAALPERGEAQLAAVGVPLWRLAAPQQ